jgi:hypothetical protein
VHHIFFDDHLSYDNGESRSIHDKSLCTLIELTVQSRVLESFSVSRAVRSSSSSHLPSCSPTW